VLFDQEYVTQLGAWNASQKDYLELEVDSAPNVRLQSKPKANPMRFRCALLALFVWLYGNFYPAIATNPCGPSLDSLVAELPAAPGGPSGHGFTKE